MAARMLLAWLLGLAVGIANACADADSSMATWLTSGHVLAYSHGHNADANDDSNGDSGTIACHGFREKLSTSIPRVLSDHDSPLIPVTMPLPMSMASVPETRCGNVRRQCNPGPAAKIASIPIVFLRLAL
ncbi:hypothetical protein [Burkholderia pseudomultivorans]|uniref:hypothetical protein n=1 Tax=Burkholderia pseudomultivorans TaxID=1207504 RepID=UPI002B267161|nr:hypothetical protein [Burkholderia pseudomultivorans]